MERNTILAVVLSMFVMMGFFWLQNTLYPPPEPQRPAPQGATHQDRPPAPPALAVPPAPAPLGTRTTEEFVPLQRVVIETDLLRVVLSNAGGDIVSYQLKTHFDGREPVEMIFSGDAVSISSGIFCPFVK